MNKISLYIILSLICLIAFWCAIIYDSKDIINNTVNCDASFDECIIYNLDSLKN